MTIEQNTILFAISLITMFFYQYSIFSYSSTILVGGIKNKWLFAFLAIINSLIFALVQYINLPLFLIILAFLIALTIEFKFISKTDFVQVFCGASIFVLHISALATPITVIISNILKISPFELLHETVYDHIVAIIVCIFLSLAHEIVKKYIDNSSIQRVTVKSRHSIILLVSIILIVILQIDHSAAIISDTYYFEQILLSLSVSFASLLIFYLFFLYAINLIDASLYKRYTDKVIGEQKDISQQKKTLLDKIEKDELTGVYNRGYIMSLLEKMCTDESNKDAFYVLFLDINALKYTNDTYGHKAGDRLITKITHAILNTVREHDIVARIGGDEFLVVLPQSQGEDCENIVERIMQYIEHQNKTEEFLVSASIGSIYVDEQARKQGVSYILSTADKNMRKNKALFYKNRKEDTV